MTMRTDFVGERQRGGSAWGALFRHSFSVSLLLRGSGDKQQSTKCDGGGRRRRWKVADKDDDSGGNCGGDGGGGGRATVATATTVAEATAAETRVAKQQSRDNITSGLADVVFSRTVVLGEQWRYFGIFFSICTCKQIICKTDTDTRICRFHIRKYNPQIKTWSFCKAICVSV